MPNIYSLPEGRVGLFPIHNLPTHNRRHNFPRKLPAIERSVLRFGFPLRGFVSPALLGIENRHIGMAATGQRASTF
jgi:hypothetical protein